MIRVLVLLISALTCSLSVASASHPDDGEWWFSPYPKPFDSDRLHNKMPLISVKDTRFVDQHGKTFIFRGVNLSDPDKLVKNTHWNKKHFKEAADWGANVIRLPIHPISWQSRGQEAYLELLDQAVIWANELNVYLIFDWHSMGNVEAGLFQHQMYKTDTNETRQFWQTIAFRYKGVNTIAFYELLNEPTDGEGRFGKLEWPQWKTFNESLIDIIYAYDKNVITLVAGFDWAYELSSARGNLIERPNVAYVSHPYPQKAEGPQQKQRWHDSWGFISEHAPLIATEIGWMRSGEHGGHYPVINDDYSYGPAIVDYLESIGASWVAWVFDPDWTPNMFEDWDYTPTQQGEYFRKTMTKLNR